MRRWTYIGEVSSEGPQDAGFGNLRWPSARADCDDADGPSQRLEIGGTRLVEHSGSSDHGASRQRVLDALSLRVPDSVPWIEAGVDTALQLQIMHRDDFTPLEFARELGLDAITVDFLPPLFVENRETSLRVFIENPLLTSPEALSIMQFPNASTPSYYDEAKRFVDLFGGDRAIGARIRLGVSPTLMSMGLEAFSFAILDYPGLVEEVLRRYCDWSVEVVRHLPDVGVDFVWAFDDMAHKTGPMFSPQVFREIFLPRLRTVADTIRGTRLPWIFHSDGNLMPILDDLLSLGMNGLHPIEPGAMDINEVKERYGQRLCLVGNIDLHYTLTMGTPAEVEDEVRQRIEHIGEGGGYMISSANSIASYCKLENVLAMRDAIERHRSYSCRS